MAFEPPVESTILCDFGYKTTFFKPNDSTKFTDVGFFMAGDPNGEYPKRGGALIAGMREPLRIVHSDKSQAVLTSST